MLRLSSLVRERLRRCRRKGRMSGLMRPWLAWSTGSMRLPLRKGACAAKAARAG